MYTQCPDCEIAFKVTADVLRQAAGKVRCGGCGNAFNALVYLSEQLPKQPVAKEVNAAVPELKPEIIDTDDGLPHSISAEQSAALLKTLDQLAGSDIRIEDTGVEWRVLDEQEAAEPAADDDDAGLTAEAATKNVDEFLDDTETPIDEFLTATPEVVDAPEIFDEKANAAVDELRFDDNTPLPDDFDLEFESSFVSKPVPEVEDDVVDAVFEEARPEVALSEPDEWTDILGEFEDLVEEVSAPIKNELGASEDVHESVDNQVQSGEAFSEDQPLDMDSQFALQAEAMGIDLSGINEIETDAAEEGVLEFEAEEELQELGLVDEQEELIVEDLVDEPDDESEDELEQLDLIDEQQALIEEPIIESHTIENELAGLDDEQPPASLAGNDADDDSVELYVPPLTEAEQTVNMQIDQDLMALAIEDEDGFASTIIIPASDTERKAHEENPAMDDDDGKEESPGSDNEPGFETIIMEGECIRSALDSNKLAADAAEAAELAGQARAKDAEQARQSGPKRYGIIAGVIGLVLLLAIQVMHQSREALATRPAFGNTIGQVYRAIGKPVQPAWNITGWRIEASNDTIQVEEGEENLTVYSRIGNDSDGPLPYPLISISLTDRFLETLGNQILDPAEYLPGDLDPRKLVAAGNTFNAVISIKSPPAEASGYKVDVCYRMSGGQLRCKANDFK